MLPPPVKLPKGEVHLWIEELHCDPAKVEQSRVHLSSEELARAGRFLHEKHRNAFVFCHARLREILANYLGLTPKEVSFTFEKYGKPQLRADLNPANLNFNLSHSGNLMMVGLVSEARIGVDIEEIRPEAATLDVADRFFTARENEQLRILERPEQIRAFFNCWTRKEAYLKAIGAGLSIDPREVEVSLLPSQSARFGAVPATDHLECWSLFSFSQPTYAAAIATDASNNRVQIKSG